MHIVSAHEFVHHLIGHYVALAEHKVERQLFHVFTWVIEWLARGAFLLRFA